MELKAFIDVMNRLAPPETALSFDNCGLIVGTEKTDIRRVLVALDCTTAVADEAARVNADLVLTHHPVLFNAVKRILPDDPETAAVYKLIRSGIGCMAVHTNLDAAEGGVNTELCRIFGLKNTVVVPPENIMRVGELETPMQLDQFAKTVEEKLHTTALICGEDRLVRKVAVMGGAGGGDCAFAKEYGADVYLTGECKHNQAIAAGVLGLAVIAAGHYETENPVLEPLIRYLKANTRNVEYILSGSNKAVFRTCRGSNDNDFVYFNLVKEDQV
ncbi:MAG: Nif3-like dinuclear metal center hexameric protein [Clostridia bacterium]|nr:Nif3-like dinuclear metal center hexameric protein [Clostridia bacterium]MBQ2111070.1 Nif3-like dinuclear metal center hexameric protein [Clostridia bacterium]MBQ5488237.1 Nif3-like dinuclear metal center hexameric protein [Clostridia bacterium]